MVGMHLVLSVVQAEVQHKCYSPHPFKAVVFVCLFLSVFTALTITAVEEVMTGSLCRHEPAGAL